MTSMKASLSASFDAEKKSGKVYNAQVGGTCFATLSHGYEKCVTGGEGAAPRAACKGLYEGTTPEGGECLSPDECVAGLSCIGTSSGSGASSASGGSSGGSVSVDLGTRVCAVKPRAQLGEGCGAAVKDIDLLCVEGAVCDYVGGKCVAPPAPGEPCVAGRCNDAGYCDAAAGTATCRARAKAGENCSPYMPGATPWPADCVSGYRCDGKTCVADQKPIDAEVCKEFDHQITTGRPAKFGGTGR